MQSPFGPRGIRSSILKKETVDTNEDDDQNDKKNNENDDESTRTREKSAS